MVFIGEERYDRRPVPQHLAERLSAWLDRHRVGVLVASLVITLLGGFLVSQMPIQASLTNLLPSSQRSVRDLQAIQHRARPFGTVTVLLESSDVKLRERAGDALAVRLATLRPDLVHQLSVDDAPLYRFLWEQRFMFATLDDLEAARDALKGRIERAKLEANPLFISLEESTESDRLDKLDADLTKLEQQALRPQSRISKDGRMQLFHIQTTFPASDAKRARILLDAVEGAIANVKRETGPGVHYGLTGNITYAMHEHDSVLEGMTLAVIVTVLLVSIALLLYYKSTRVLLAILWALAVGVAATFAVAWATIGHLNVMTAFLFAIVIGNGINAGMLVAARFLEELRAGRPTATALPDALANTFRGTGAAVATAAVAYGSLLVTDFRGFRQFGAIAGIGMVLTWIAAYTVLPAILCSLARRGLIGPTKEPKLSLKLGALVPERNYGRVIAIGGFVTGIAAAITVVYIARDPFTTDWRDLQSNTPAIDGARALDAKIRTAFDSRALLSAQAYQIVIAVEDRAQVAPLVAKLRADDAARPPERRWIRDVRSLDDLLPPDQDKKLAVLAEIRALLDNPDLQATLSPTDRERLHKVRPPETLRRVGDGDVPGSLSWPFIEKDGSRGRLIVVRGAARFNSFDVADRLAFAREVRALELPPGALVAGEALVVADIIQTMERDAPLIIAFALFGSMLMVVLILGVRRHGLVTIGCGLAGVLVMIASCALLGIKVHFLDLIALPITIGIGIDYAVNLAARDRLEGDLGPQHVVRTTGSTVLMCSYTTAVGYGTLMLSANGGIRSFGLAALVGELSSIAMAVIIAPVCLAALRARSRTP